MRRRQRPGGCRPDPGLAGAVADLATVEHALGRLSPALAGFRLALTLHRRDADADPLVVATVLTHIGLVQRDLRHFAVAVECLNGARMLEEAALGSRHPRLGVTSSNLGTVLWEAGDHDEALRHLRHGWMVLHRAHGAGHPDTRWAHHLLRCAHRT